MNRFKLERIDSKQMKTELTLKLDNPFCCKDLLNFNYDNIMLTDIM